VRVKSGIPLEIFKTEISRLASPNHRDPQCPVHVDSSQMPRGTKESDFFHLDAHEALRCANGYREG
jgi:hypothetical protein